MADSGQTPAFDAQDRWLFAAGYLVALVRKLVIAVEQRAVSDFWSAYSELIEWREKYWERSAARVELLRRARGDHKWQDIPAELIHDIPGVLALEVVDRIGDPLPWRAVPDTVRELLGINVSSPTLLALINRIEGEHNRAFHEAAGARIKKPRNHKRQPIKGKALTAKQAEAVQIVGECKGDIAEAARRLGVDRKTVAQHYEAATKKLGKAVVKHATKALPNDRRGQANLSADDDRRR